MTYKFIPAGFEKPPIKRHVIPKDNKLEAKLKEWMEEQSKYLSLYITTK